METEMPTAAHPVMNENVVDDEVIVIPDDPPELHSVEPTDGHAAMPPLAGTSDQVWERAGPVDMHLLEYIESKINKNTKRTMDQCVRRFREFLMEFPRRETRDIGNIPAKELNVLIGEFLIDLKKKKTGLTTNPIVWQAFIVALHVTYKPLVMNMIL